MLACQILKNLINENNSSTSKWANPSVAGNQESSADVKSIKVGLPRNDRD